MQKAELTLVGVRKAGNATTRREALEALGGRQHQRRVASNLRAIRGLPSSPPKDRLPVRKASYSQDGTNVLRLTARAPSGRFVSHENDLSVTHITPRRNPTSKLACYYKGGDAASKPWVEKNLGIKDGVKMARRGLKSGLQGEPKGWSGVHEAGRRVGVAARSVRHGDVQKGLRTKSGYAVSSRLMGRKLERQSTDINQILTRQRNLAQYHARSVPKPEPTRRLEQALKDRSTPVTGRGKGVGRKLSA